MQCPCKTIDCKAPDSDITKKPWKNITKPVEVVIPPETFLYFAYGSNLLKKRIHINNPSAVFVCIGRLDDHRLDFIRYSQEWGGASATIVPTPNAHVWGSVWKINKDDLPNLDRQEGVGTNVYFPKEVIIHTSPQVSDVTCRVYQQTKNPPPRGDNDCIPTDRLPSKTYLETIIQGAFECQLPEYYIEILKKIPHNGKKASQSMLMLLNEPKNQENAEDDK